MSDEFGPGGPSAGATGGADQETREVVDNLGAAMARLRAALDRLRHEVEANAQAEWVRTKPELRQTIAELEAMVDALAQRAKTALGDLGSRLDGQQSDRNR
jgi:hypothetical protein